MTGPNARQLVSTASKPVGTTNKNGTVTIGASAVGKFSSACILVPFQKIGETKLFDRFEGVYRFSIRPAH